MKTKQEMDLLCGDDSDESTENGGFKINKKYAKSYEKWRKKEEKQKLIDKYGDDVDSSSSEEEEIVTTKKLDQEWLRAYAVTRFNQPRLYTGEKLFNEEVKTEVTKSEKKITLKDHERKFILEKGGMASEEEDDDNISKTNAKSYYEEQEDIKSSLKKAIGDIESDDEESEEDTLLVKKTKSKKEKEEDENDYLSWLKGETDKLEDEKAAEELAPLKDYWSNPNLTDKEKILRDYILNNGYMDKENSDDEESEDDDSVDFEDEEEFLDEADKYEKTYNFRHEEPGGIEIKTYPRTIETSVRAKEENRRIEKRKRKNEKKQKEKEKQQEEIRLLRKLQKEEKEQKLRKLKDASENPDLEYNLDDDFDPEEHNRIMQKYFDDSYYQEADCTTKPVFEPDEDDPFEDESDQWWQQRSEAQKEMENDLGNGEAEDETMYADDPGFVMDADYDPNNVTKTTRSKKDTKKKKKKKAKAETSLFDPTTKSFDEYLNEYLKDKINNLPFTYREVVPNNFGLSTEEILEAEDKELNSWVSVKKMSMYRNQEEENRDFHKFRMKSQNPGKKMKTFPSFDQQRAKSNKKKKKNKKEKEADGTVVKKSLSEENVPSGNSKGQLEKKNKKKRGKKRPLFGDNEERVSGGCAMEESSNASKVKRKRVDVGDDMASKLSHHVGSPGSEKRNDLKKDKRKGKDGKPIAIDKESVEQKEDLNSKTQEGGDQNKTKKKKNKKKKLKLRLNDSDFTEAEQHKPQVKDKKKAKEDLRKVMSSSRLSSYGIGHKGAKHANKFGKKKKKKPAAADKS